MANARNRPARLIRGFRRWTAFAVALAILATLAPLALSWGRGHPQDLPWTPLDLARPIGFFTGSKLNRLSDSFPRCAALLDRAGVTYTILPPRVAADGHCGFAGAVSLTGVGAQRIAFRPATMPLACPVAAGLAVWEWEVVQPAAQRWFGQQVIAIDTFGSYNCRKIRGEGVSRNLPYSEHAGANAVDIAAFTLADGMRISVARDWRTGDRNAAFLRNVRNGACRLYATTLSPDFNAAHHDHLHLDQAKRGPIAWPVCR